MKTTITLLCFFWQTFCLAEGAVHVHDCGGTLSEPARKTFNEAQVNAGLLFRQRFGEEFDLLWDGDCSRKNGDDFHVVIWEETPKAFQKEHKNALACGDGAGGFVIRYDFARKWATHEKVSLPKVVGAAILSVFVLDLTRTTDVHWTDYDFHFINKDLPQGWTSEVVDEVRKTLALRFSR